jgi:hypothetical protein
LVALEKAKLLCGSSKQDEFDNDGLEEYLVSDPGFNREVAVKFLNAYSVNNNRAREHIMGNRAIEPRTGDPEIDSEIIDLVLEPASEHRSNRFEEDDSIYEIETIDLSLILLSANRVSGYN